MFLHKRNQKHKPPNIPLLKFGNTRIQSARPRASATAGTTKDTVSCGTSATRGSAGRQRCLTPMSTSWISIQAGSHRRITTTVRTVFRCVASRNRKKETLAKKKQPSSAEQHPAPGCRSALEPGRVGLKRGYDGYSWSSTIPSGNTNAHLLVFYYFLARMASKTPGGRGFQLRCLQEHPEGVLLGFSPPMRQSISRQMRKPQTWK